MKSLEDMDGIGKAVVIVSGGMDSVGLCYLMAAQGVELHMLSFDYGQKHNTELAHAAIAADDLGAKHNVLNLRGMGALLDSALTNEGAEIPHGHYAADNMKATVVPNRNAIMLSIAWGIAVSVEADAVATAVHGGDHFIYPDCRPEFAYLLNAAFRAGNEGHGDVRLYAPFIGVGKHDIVSLVNAGVSDVPWAQTWSCYEGGLVHCGKCGTCVERKEAFELAGVTDPTTYAGAE